ncbi:type VI secretion system baseplate subunit TssG [Pseudoalteromonas fenneropenaei]|uniref:Type VI secretion system baseplate subunit TssG n=1 Tax=Pseudoalteromonas fenneropenaei TaxID=1737459 RepID=A0ABV7CHV3_9GAMM
MTTQPQNPIWAKLPEPILKLLETPWQFGLFPAIAMLEKHWASEGELSKGLSDRVKLTPYKEFGFPGSDLRASQLKIAGKGQIQLSSAYFGLYGIDSPLPHYVLEQALRDDESSARTRAFIDIFNHVLYCQLYQAWQKSQSGHSGIGSQQFDAVIAAVLQSKEAKKSHLGIASLKQTSAAGLTQLLRQALSVECLQLDDLKPVWQPLSEVTQLGQKGTTLGANTLLGEQVLVSGTRVAIHVGPLSTYEAEHFKPHGQQGQQLARLMAHHVSCDIDWQLELDVIMPAQPALHFGEEIKLGGNACLGAREQKQTRMRYQKVQFAIN